MSENWSMMHWDNNKGEAYFAHRPDLVRPDTEYWLIRKKGNGVTFLKDLEFEEYEDCLKVWQCGSDEEVRALELIMRKLEEKQEKKAGRNYLILICIIILVAFI
ncbi:MAG: hypothetical protein KAJ07_11165 [Planctomycetes bacterium]|nr:hypothetical protein [Planctomycetota bacterium]